MVKKCIVEISARHIHIPENVYHQLFGPDAKMNPVKILDESGSFVDERRVTLVGPKGEMKRVAILGPHRPLQVELSRTDARRLGIDAPIRLSGDTLDSASVRIIGTYGEIMADDVCIIPKRHIHISDDDARLWGVENNQVVMVRINSDNRSTIYDDVVIRINDNSGSLPARMHIDTDEGNATGMTGKSEGIIIEDIF